MDYSVLTEEERARILFESSAQYVHQLEKKEQRLVGGRDRDRIAPKKYQAPHHNQDTSRNHTELESSSKTPDNHPFFVNTSNSDHVPHSEPPVEQVDHDEHNGWTGRPFLYGRSGVARARIQYDKLHQLDPSRRKEGVIHRQDPPATREPVFHVFL